MVILQLTDVKWYLVSIGFAFEVRHVLASSLTNKYQMFVFVYCPVTIPDNLKNQVNCILNMYYNRIDDKQNPKISLSTKSLKTFLSADGLE